MSNPRSTYRDTAEARSGVSGDGHRLRAEHLLRRYRLIGEDSCPRSLVGLPHLDDCWCMSRLHQHGRRWVDVSAPSMPLVLWEPFNVNGADIGAVTARAEADGIGVEVTGESPYDPGGSFALVFYALEAEP
jgi:hypothetical protein